MIFVGVRFAEYGDQLELSRFGTSTWALVALFATVYGVANVFLAQAWWQILHFLDVDVGRVWAIRTYGVSQLAKYVPGNVVHFASRQALGAADGLASGALAKSVIWELGLIAVGDALFGVLAIPLLWNSVSVALSIAIFGAMSAIVIFVLRGAVSKSVSAALSWQIAFLAVSGAVFVAGLALVSPSSLAASTLPLICAAYAVAWLAGLITPGAPAGVGVRELVLIQLLKGQVAPEDLLVAVVLGRAVTVAGDSLFFLASLLLGRPWQSRSRE